MQKLFRFNLIVAGLISTGHAAADEPPQVDLPAQIVPIVTATRLAQNPLTSLSDTTVLYREDIERSGARDLTQVLQRTLGVEALAQGPEGAQSSVFIRGANSNQTVMLVDGVRLNNVTGNQASFQLIPLAQIERIEVVRGAASSIYGADAVGGVIQVFTKKPDEGFHAAIGAGLGNRSTSEANASIWGTNGDLRYSATLSRQQTNGFSATNAQSGNVYNPVDGFRNTAFSGSLGYEWRPGQILTARVLTSQGRAQYNAYTPAAYDPAAGGVNPDAPSDSHYQINQYSLESLNQMGKIQSKLLISQAEDKSDNHSFDASCLGYGAQYNCLQYAYRPSQGNFNNREQRALWALNGDLNWGRWLAGAEYSRQALASSTVYANTTRHNRAVFAGLDAHARKWLAEANVRYDDNSQFGGAATGKLGLGYRVTPNWTARASYATSFRAPSFNELYYPGYSNPHLQPERGRNLELGAYYQNDSTRFQAALFQNRLTDMIALDKNWTPQNIHRATLSGLNVGARRQFGKVGVYGDASWQNSHNDTEHAQLLRRAKVFGDIGVDYAPNERLSIGANVHASGPTQDYGGVHLGGYALVSASAKYQITPRWDVSVTGDNIFNKHYTTAYGYNTPGASVMVRTRYEF